MKNFPKTVAVSVLLVLLLVALPFTWARSQNNCSQCHGSSQQQYLDILETNSATAIPTSIGVGETKTVSVAIQNICSASRYTQLSNVQVTLSSSNGKISVTSPTYNIGQLPVGTKVAKWTIQGIAAGSDSLTITCQATNSHNSVQFIDTISPSPSISVTSGNVEAIISVNDKTTGRPIEGASVSLDAIQKQTNLSGVAVLTIAPGTHTLTVTKTGYQTISESVNMASSTSLTRSLTPTSSTTYPVTITVQNSAGQSIAGVNVTLGALHAVTDSAGVVVIQIASGNYAATLTKTGYSSIAQDIAVTAATSLRFTMKPVSNSEYQLTIIIKDGSTSNNLANASVALNGVKKVTDATGTVSFSVKTGTYVLEIQRAGYTNISEIVTLSGDTGLIENLTPAPPHLFLLTISVIDDSQEKIPGANVTVDGAVKITDVGGVTYFALQKGAHQLLITKQGYSVFNETITQEGTENITRSITKLPTEPAQDWTPFMIFIHPPLAILSYLFVFAFTAYIYLLADGTKTLTRLGGASWLFTLAALLSGMIWAQNAWGSYWSWEPKETTSLALFILVSATIITYYEGRNNTARVLSLISCLPILLALPTIFMLVGFGFLLLVVAIKSDQVEARQKQHSPVKSIAAKLNRISSWLFIVFTLLTLLSGYTMTRFGLLTPTNLNSHNNFGYIFGAMLAIHVILSVLSGYPWKRILVSLIEKRNAMIIALNLQETTAFLLLVLGAVQFFTGLGYINSDVASVIPKGVHLQLNGLLIYSLLIHGVVGLRAVMQRNRIKMPGRDLFYLILGMLLLVAVAYLKL